jgi:tape measure domain-containing protein
MADLDFTVSADTSSAQRNLKQLEGSVNSLGKVFGALAGAISAKAFADITSGFTDLQSRLKNATGSADDAAKVFDRLSATARTTYTSINQTAESFLRNSQALRDLGYNTEQQIQVSEALNNALAISGTKGQQAESVMNALSKAFATGTLSGENLNTVIANGGRITQALADGLGITTLQLRALGRAGELDTARVLQILIDQSQKLKKEASEMPATINDGFVILTNSLTKLVGEFDKIAGSSSGASGVLERLADSIDQFTKFLKDNAAAVKDFVDGLTRIAIVVGSLFVLNKLTGWIFATSVAALSAGKGFMSLMGTLTGLGLVVDKAKSGWYLLTSLFVGFKNILTGRASVVAGVAALSGAIGRLIPVVGVAYVGFEALNFALKRLTGQGFGDWFDKLKEKLGFAKEEAKETAEALASAGGTGGPTGGGLTVDLLKKQREEVDKIANAYYKQNLELTKRLNFENGLIGLSEKQQQVKQSLFDLENDYLQTINQLLDLYGEKSRSKNEEDQNALPLIRERIEAVTIAYEKQIGVVKGLTEANFEKLEAERQSLALSEFSIRNQIDNQNRLRAIQDDIAKTGMTEIQKKYYDIARASQQSARSAIESENSRRRSLGLAKMTAQEEEQYYQRANSANEDLIRATEELYQKSRQFNTGWKNAFNQYIDDATNAAKVAENVFRKATQGMEDLIVNFAKTGKFEWKNFVASLAEELLRSQVRQLMANLFTIGQPRVNSTGNFLGSLLGFANGGIIPTNKPVLVGERGPEILSGAAGRTVIPNEQLGGTTVVNYNISAVDAMSFKQMIARDPGFIHAVAQQGAKAVPGRF